VTTKAEGIITITEVHSFLTRKTSGLIQISNSDLNAYLKRNKLLLTYLILNQSVSTIIGRNMLFKEKAQQYRNFLLSYETSEEIVTYDMVEMQIMFLDLLSNIFMFLEDYLGHSYHLKTSMKDFPKQIASMNKRVAEKEIKYLKRLKKNNISSYLLLPDETGLGLNKKEISLVRKNFKNIVARNYNRIKNIVEFYRRYYRVYTKYKHILPAVLGVYRRIYDISKRKNILASDIFVRDYIFTKGGRKRYHTYILHSTGLEPLNYLEDVMDDLKNVFEILLLSRINSMSNLGESFLIPVYNYIDTEDKVYWDQIIEKVNKIPQILPELKIIININDPLKTKMEKMLAKHSVFKLPRDLFTN
jgi:hypothetical protein